MGAGSLCPTCWGVSLVGHLTREGVELDSCPSCGGVWLQKGELFWFSRRPRALAEAMGAAIQQAAGSGLPSPESRKPMARLSLLDGQVTGYWCSDSGGLWFSRQDLDTIVSDGRLGVRIRLYPRLERARTSEVSGAVGAPDHVDMSALRVLKLPSLFLASGGVLAFVYLIFLVLLLPLGMILFAVAGLHPFWVFALVLAVFMLDWLVAPVMLDAVLASVFSCRWVTAAELPGQLGSFVASLAQDKQIRLPRIGIMDDGAPNAFTYGPSAASRLHLTVGRFCR